MRRRLSFFVWLAIACSSCATPGRLSRGSMTGRLQVYDELVVDNSGEGPASLVRLPPGSYPGKLDKLAGDELVLKLDAPGLDELIVKLGADAGAFPRSSGSFSFAPSSHNLRYTINGEHLVVKSLERVTTGTQMCYYNSGYEERCYNAISNSGQLTTYCTLVPVQVRGTQQMKREQFTRTEDLALSFLDPQSSEVVGRYYEGSDERREVETTRLTSCM